MQISCGYSEVEVVRSFNLTRGMKILRGGGGLRKFLDTRKGGSENLYTSKPTGGGRLLKN